MRHGHRRDDPTSGEESENPVWNERMRQDRVYPRSVPREACLFQKAKDKNSDQGLKPNSPPEHNRPRRALDNEAPKGRSCNGTEQEANSQGCKGQPPFVQIEDVHDSTASEDCRDRSEEAAEEPRNNKRLILIRMCHEG